MDSRGECKQISVEAKLENLERVNEFVEYCLKDRDCSAKVKMQLELVVEEIFTNIANYAYGGNVGDEQIFGVGRIAAHLGIKVGATILEATIANNLQHGLCQRIVVDGELVGVPTILIVTTIGVD